MNSGQKRGCVFRVSSCYASPPLQIEKGIFYQVASLIELLVIIALHSAVLFWGDNRHHSLPLRLVNDCIGIVTAIRQKIFRFKPVNQSNCLRTICCCTLCNKSPERHAMRIHGQMQFCVEPPFVRLMAWLPPFAPAACG